jgi:hypothetical protein
VRQRLPDVAVVVLEAEIDADAASRAIDVCRAAQSIGGQIGRPQLLKRKPAAAS